MAPPFPLERCDRGLIEAALASPRTGWGPFEKYSDLPAKAAALLYAFAKLQACPEGNKRLALLIVDAFVRLNNARLDTRGGELAAMILEVAETEAGERDEVQHRIAGWLRSRVVSLGPEDT